MLTDREEMKALFLALPTSKQGIIRWLVDDLNLVLRGVEVSEHDAVWVFRAPAAGDSYEAVKVPQSTMHWRNMKDLAMTYDRTFWERVDDLMASYVVGKGGDPSA